MTFKMKLHIKLLFVLFLMFILNFFIAKFSNEIIPSKYVLPTHIAICIGILMYICIYKEYYELENGLLKIYKGRKCEVIKLSNILYININSLERGSGNSFCAIHNIAYIVTVDKRVQISTSLYNEKNKNLVSVLKTKHNKKIKYDK